MIVHIIPVCTITDSTNRVYIYYIGVLFITNKKYISIVISKNTKYAGNQIWICKPLLSFHAYLRREQINISMSFRYISLTS